MVPEGTDLGSTWKLRVTPSVGNVPVDLRCTGVARETNGLGPVPPPGNVTEAKREAAAPGAAVALGVKADEPAGT